MLPGFGWISEGRRQASARRLAGEGEAGEPVSVWGRNRSPSTARSGLALRDLDGCRVSSRTIRIATRVAALFEALVSDWLPEAKVRALA